MNGRAAASRLRQEFVAAFRPFVVARLAELGIDAPSGLDHALAAGERWLEDELAAFTETPFRDQRRSPLEVFQEAMRFPGDALAEADVQPPPRDPGAAMALPGDIYDLAPASSQDLGEAAWRAHLAWGAEKARTFAAGPAARVGWLGRNLMDRSRIEAAVTAASLELQVWSSEADLAGGPEERRPLMAFIDLEHPDADGAISALAASGVRTIAYGPHVDDLAMMRARGLGADEVHARSRFFRDLADLLPKLA